MVSAVSEDDKLTCISAKYSSASLAVATSALRRYRDSTRCTNRWCLHSFTVSYLIADKRSEGKRQVKTTLFGLFPENMHRGSRNLKDGLNPPVRTNLPMNPSASVSKSMANSATTVIVEPMKTTTTTSQGTRREDQEHSKDQQQNQTPFTELEQPSSPTSSSSSNRESDEESPLIGASDYNYYDTIYGKESVWPIVSPGIYTPVYEPARYEVWNLPDLYRAPYAYNFPNPGPSYASWKFDAPYQQNAYQVPDKKPSLVSL